MEANKREELLIEAGVCIKCAVEKPTEGSKTCSKCVKPLSRKEYLKNRYAELAAKGVCRQCAAKPVRQGGKMCVDCYAEAAEAASRDREKFKALGICPACRTEKLVPGGRGGASRCPKCYEKEVARSKRNYAKVKAAGLCVQCFKEPKAEGRTSCARCVRRSLLLRFKPFGLTEEKLDALGNKCEICGDTKKLHIDHDHKTGKIRGLLCQNCNLAIGQFNDDKELLKTAARYLLEHDVKSGRRTQAEADELMKKCDVQDRTTTEPSLNN